MATQLKLLHPTPSPSRDGGDRKPPVSTCCGASGFGREDEEDSPHLIWLIWLREVLQKLVGSEDNLELSLAVVTGEVTYVELGTLWQIDRRTARGRCLELLARVRQGWLAELSATVLQEVVRTKRVAIRPFTFELTEVPPAFRVLPGCERRFASRPSVDDLGAFCGEVTDSLFARNSLLALSLDRGGNLTAAVVGPPGRNAASAANDDRFGLAA